MISERKKSYNRLKKIIIFVCIAILIITVYIYSKYSNKIELTQLRTNTEAQMMGYAIKTKNDKIIVIDGGREYDTDNLVNYINKNGGKVDYWILTHPHIDHIGAFLKIANDTQIEIEKIYTTYEKIEWYEKNVIRTERDDEIGTIKEFLDTLNSEKYKNKVENVQINEKIDFDNIKATVLGVCNPEITENAVNNSSMVIKLQVNNKSILFTGDAGKESGEKLLANEKDYLKSDIVQVAHHGQNGLDEDVYQAIQPKICFWPTTKSIWENDQGNGYNTGTLKTMQTREWIEKLNVKENYLAIEKDITIEVW